ncbi:MAG: thymidine kinase [Candidatus Phytoplasma citri]|nr:hypothetical protein [Candidatus Phytoplasma australasiaticum]MDV3199794.1 hypothetical protein [Candidatus Phytoplasma australasiaticum]WEX20122.1 MAG: thymidine kinase [Candidatus Phytoplasma aurantifolia]
MMVVDEEGFVEVICGPMFSGKTTELIKRINFLKTLQLQFLVFKPGRQRGLDFVLSNQ